MENTATPLVQMPLFLIIGVLLSLAILGYSLTTRERFAYLLGPSIGQVAANIMSWCPASLSLAGTLYFGSKLFFG